MTTNPKDEHGQAHHGLHARPLMADAGPSTHPAIATNQGADLYDTRRAAGIEAAGGDAANIRVSVSSRAKTGRKAEGKDIVIGAEKPAALKHGRRLQERSVEGQARQSHRVRVADAYLTGESTVVELADIHQVSVYTIRDWIRDRRDTFMLDHRKRPLGTRRDRAHEPSLVVGVYGTGGTMTDESVRRATRDLEKAIVAGLAARNLAPLPYRREVAA